MTARIRNRDALLEAAPPGSPRRARALALDMAEAALRAVDPRNCTIAALDALGGDLGRVTIFAFGKAARPMIEGALTRVAAGAGIAVAPVAGDIGPVKVYRGGHPIPAADAEQTGRAFVGLAHTLTEDDTALCLVSGGGSAMLELPADGVTMDEIVAATRAALTSGADIVALNERRRRLSALKGGGLARAMAPARIVNLVLSDVVDAGLEVVASGPTVGAGATTRCAADNRTAVEAAAAYARAAGRSVNVVPAPLTGEARVVALPSFDEDVQVLGGETTVVVRGDGRGGRNQELALAAFEAPGLVLTLATDGVDGASDAAGAIMDDVTRAASGGLDWRAFLDTNDSNGFFRRVGATLQTGPTGTNVADVTIRLSARNQVTVRGGTGG